MACTSSTAARRRSSASSRCAVAFGTSTSSLGGETLSEGPGLCSAAILGGGSMLLRLAIVLALALPAAAQAKDVCVSQTDQRLVFRKVKPLKKPGTIVPLQGWF